MKDGGSEHDHSNEREDREAPARDLPVIMLSADSARTNVNNLRSTRNEPWHSQRRVQAILQGTGRDWRNW